MHDLKSLGPRTINLETPNYVVRTIEIADATAGWRNWLLDPDAARNLNMQPTARSEEEILTFIGAFDRTTGHLLGIFEKATGVLVGMRAIYIDPAHSEFLVNILIGEVDARNKGARTESRDVMYRYFFEELGLQSARCSVVATNTAILKILAANGWVCEHQSNKAAASGQGLVELRHFRLTREAWRRNEADKALARAS